MKIRKSSYPLSKEHKKHISEGLMGRIVTEETRKKIGNANRGRKCLV